MEITQFIDNFNGGTRVNRFVVEATQGVYGPTEEAPEGVDGGKVGKSKDTFAQRAVKIGGYDAWPIHIRSTKLPEHNMGVIPVNYRGKTTMFPGDRALANWEFIVLDDHTDVPTEETNFNQHLHRAFMDWMNAIVGTDSRHGVMGFDGATRYPGNIWQIRQLDTWPRTETGGGTDPNTLRVFKMYNCWPKEVGPLQLDMSSDNSVNSFRVVMCYTHTDGWDTTSGTASWDGTSTV